MALVHGTAVAIDGYGVLLRGEPGRGKSDLALRLIDDHAVLVGDDYVHLEGQNQRLMVRGPDHLAGLLEVRGIGIISLPHLTRAPLGLVVDLMSMDAMARLPEPVFFTHEAYKIPLINVDPTQPSATARVRLALRHLAQRLDAGPC